MPKNVSSFNSTSPANMTEGEWKSRVECVAGHHLLELYRLTDMVEGMLGLRVEYHKNGQLWMKGTYKDGELDGPWVSYYEDGQLFWKGTYKDGKEHGPYVSYHDNGQLESKAYYKAGEKDGRWLIYERNGTLVTDITYKDGLWRVNP